MPPIIPQNARAGKHPLSSAFSLIVNVAGTAAVKTVVLMTPEKVDQPVKKSGAYRPPGG